MRIRHLAIRAFRNCFVSTGSAQKKTASQFGRRSELIQIRFTFAAKMESFFPSLIEVGEVGSNHGSLDQDEVIAFELGYFCGDVPADAGSKLDHFSSDSL